MIPRAILFLVPALTLFAQTADDFIHETAIWRQMEIGNQIAVRGDVSVIPQLRPLLQDSDRHVRGNAAFVIAKLGDHSGFDAVVAILKDGSPDRALWPPAAYIGPKSQKPQHRSLEQQIREDCYYAVHLLGELKNPEAIPILETLFGDPALADDARQAIAWIKAAQ